jgi:hypothetical protein
MRCAQSQRQKSGCNEVTTQHATQMVQITASTVSDQSTVVESVSLSVVGVVSVLNEQSVWTDRD